MELPKPRDVCHMIKINITKAQASGDAESAEVAFDCKPGGCDMERSGNSYTCERCEFDVEIDEDTGDIAGY